MLLWILFAGLTAAVVASLIEPLRKQRSGPLDEPADVDLATYRDQLQELEAEQERGLISPQDAESARNEVARRLIRRSTAGDAERAGATPEDTVAETRASRLLYAVAAAVPLVSIALYLAAGRPELPARPFAERQSAPIADKSIAEVIDRIEQQLREHPDDGKGWDVVAPVYLRLERYADAAYAYAQSNRLLGENVKRLMGFAQATMLAENGIVTDPVRGAANRILALEPDRIEPRIWLTLGKEQDGDLAGALADFKAMLEKAPADAPWREPVTNRMAAIDRKLKGLPDPAPAPEASSEAPTAGAGPADGAGQAAFINQMVERLAARLKENAKDLDGWLRLARSYKVLDRTADAQGALAEARKTFAGDDKALADIAEAEKALGLGQ